MPSQFSNGLDRFLERREGLLGLVVGSRDAAATRAAWAAAGASPDEVKALGRLLESEGGPVELRFRNVMLPRTDTGGLGLFACEHLTPAPMRRPAWLAHPNGAKAIRSCTIVVADVRRRWPRRWRGCSARPRSPRTDNVVAAHTGQGVIVVAPPEDAELIHPLLDLPEPPGEPMLVALTLEVADPERAAAFLRLQGVPFTRSPAGDVLIPPAEAHGVALELVAVWR